MIHTAQFYIFLEANQVSALCKKFKLDIALLPAFIDTHYEGVKTVFRKYGLGWWMFVYIDFIKLLGKPDIWENDVLTIRKEMNGYLYRLFESNAKEFTLICLDYRIDAILPDPEHRKLLLKLYKKTTEQYGFKRKNAHYSTTIYFNSSSVKVICYDKEAERNAKGEEIIAYERNVLRFEVSILNRHLNYMKQAHGLEKRLESYMTAQFWTKYMTGNLCPLFYEGDYHKITTATSIIELSNFKEREKQNLRRFLCDVSKSGISGIRALESTVEEGVKKLRYSDYLIRKYINMLASLHINPLLIPKNVPIKLGKEKCIPNPFESCLL
ncbi:phage/plasmid replication domain-containing protein [Paenibacillus sp. FSL L8-0499]|uniref:phage/plasmid replication domain-containing protein n=1 Tax=Paenibacillus sp. FSL L8-0499 TaxID=2975334 RepID=UPI0030F5DF46